MSGAVARIAKPVMRGLHVNEVKRYVVVWVKKYKPVMHGLHVSEVKRYVVVWVKKYKPVMHGLHVSEVKRYVCKGQQDKNRSVLST